jgi:hypothetical protein
MLFEEVYMKPPLGELRQFTMKLTGTREELEPIMAMMRQWSDMVPTAYFLDVCSISHIKTYQELNGFKDARHEKSIKELQAIDFPHNGVSYLPALMEKASDQRSNFTAETFVEEAKRDWNAIRTFFKARVIEPFDFVEAYATELFGVSPEQGAPEYLEFLRFANDMGLYNSVGEAKRLKTAKEICAKADALGIVKYHPVVLSVLACVYGCMPAKKVMKFSSVPENFNPGNALGDIQLIPRVGGKLSHAIHHAGMNGAPFIRSIFMTADSPLHQLFSYFFVKNVSTTETEEGSSDKFSVNVKGTKLFVDLFDSEGNPKDEVSAAELDKLYAVIGVQEPAPSE